MTDAREDEDESKRGPNEEEGSEESEDSHLYEDWDELATDPEEMSRFSRTLEGLLPDIVKKGAKGLVSEDGLRSLVKDREIPREAVGFILGQVDATRGEVVRIVSREVRTFLENVDLGGELTKILTSVSFEIRTEVRFIPNDAAVKPNIRNRVSVRSQNEEKAAASKEAASKEEEQELKEKSNSEEGELDSAQEEDSQPKRRRWSLRGRGARDQSDEVQPDDDETEK